MAEGGALQAGWLRGQGLRLQLKGVTKGARAQAVERLDSNPAEGLEAEGIWVFFSFIILVLFLEHCGTPTCSWCQAVGAG